jgi:hypothetical protein
VVGQIRWYLPVPQPRPGSLLPWLCCAESLTAFAAKMEPLLGLPAPSVQPEV